MQASQHIPHGKPYRATEGASSSSSPASIAPVAIATVARAHITSAMGFLALVLVLALGAVIPGTSATSSWKLCDSKEYPVTVQGVTVNPDPVVSGDVAEFLVPAITDEVITGGTVSITVYFHNIPVHSEKDDLCSKTPCPIQPGEFTLKNSEVLPKVTPPGSYKIKLQILDSSANVLACTYVNFEITWNWASQGSKTTDVPSILHQNAGVQPALSFADK